MPRPSSIHDTDLKTKEAAAAGHGCEGPEKNGQNAIDVERIVKKYGDFTAVDDITFHVGDEEIFGCSGRMEQASRR